MKMKTIHNTVDEIFELYEKYGNHDYIGEDVSQIEHMSQAAQLAMEFGYDDEVVLAAFFHDIGHLCVSKTEENDMGGFGVVDHEKLGASFLEKRGFPKRMVVMIENHVNAKRYLVYKDASYLNGLSEASRQTLMMQGGPMSEEEAMYFEAQPYFIESVTLRKWDEMAKTTNVPVINLDILKAKAVDVLLKHLRI
jgi:2-amino-1-hydroxyethylphosphonate dioxygenase (glycine-forming)